MNMHYSGSLNGFWARRNVMRPGPMALAGPGSSLGKKVGPMDRNVKLEFKAQISLGVPCRTVVISRR